MSGGRLHPLVDKNLGSKIIRPSVNLDKHRRKYKNGLEASSSMESKTKRHSGEGRIMYIRTGQIKSKYVSVSMTLTVNVFTI